MDTISQKPSLAHKFIQWAIEQNVLLFGSFTLKSGRESPYFFNLGKIQTGKALNELSEFYAKALSPYQDQFDVLFGPAYKGITLASATSMELYKLNGKPQNFAYNRKEQKKHGEGGQVVGSIKEKKIWLIDDVITAGTAISEVMPLLNQSEVVGLIIALDRQEKNAQNESTIQSISKKYKIKTISLASFTDLLSFIELNADFKKYIPEMNDYFRCYGISS